MAEDIHSYSFQYFQGIKKELSRYHWTWTSVSQHYIWWLPVLTKTFIHTVLDLGQFLTWTKQVERKCQCFFVNQPNPDPVHFNSSKQTIQSYNCLEQRWRETGKDWWVRFDGGASGPLVSTCWHALSAHESKQVTLQSHKLNQKSKWEIAI